MGVFTNLMRKFSSAPLKEGTLESVFGTPIDFASIYSAYNMTGGAFPSPWGRDLFPDRSSTIRTPQQLDLIRNFCRVLYETNPSAKGVLSNISNYVIGAGFDVKVESKDEKSENKRLIAKVQAIIDDFCETNDIDEWYDEVFVRAEKDGEVFIRIFPTEDGVQIRAIEPDHIRTPFTQSTEGDWSFGIKTMSHDIQTPLEYNITYPDSTEERVPAHFIKHLKRNVNKNTKRGLSTFYACMDELKLTDSLREAVLQGEKVRNSIAYIRQFATAPQSTIQNMQDNAKTHTLPRLTENGTTQNVAVQKIESGAVVDIPKGLEMKDPPGSPNTTTSQEIMVASLAVVAAAFNCPEWMVTGKADGSSYSSALIAESPFMKTITKHQRIHTKFWISLFRDVVDIAIAQGNLPGDTLEKINICVAGPNPNVRGTKEQVESQLLLVKQGVQSLHTLATQNNLDLDSELARINEEKNMGLEHGENTTTEPSSSAPQTASGEMQKDQKE